MAEYAFRYTEKHLIASLARYGKQTIYRRWLQPFKLFCFVGIVILLGLFIYIRAALPIIIFATLLVLLLLGPRIDYWLMKRRFRRSPFYNSDVLVTVGPEGVTSTDDKSRVALKWSAFTKAHRFSDGFLLLIGSQFFWLPDSSLRTGSVSEVESLVNSNVSKYNGT